LVFAALKLKIKWEQCPVCRYHLLTGQKMKKEAININQSPLLSATKIPQEHGPAGIK
jgi:hypothetical protein